MADVFTATLPEAKGLVVDLCLCIPGALLRRGDVMGAREVIAALIKRGREDGDGFVGESVKTRKPKPSILANLWLAQTGYAYYQQTQDMVAWRAVLLPYLKRVAQAVVAGKFAGVVMNDAGLVSVPDEPEARLIELNVLWYNLMSILAEALRTGGDRTGDHFERLAGRFRRAFLNLYWCEQHSTLCEPRSMTAADHAAVVLEPASLLAATLPFSAIPRTRQRQLVAALAARGRRPLGLVVPGDLARGARKGEGEIISPLYLAWAAEGLVKTAEWGAKEVAEAKEWLAAAHAVCAAGEGKLARFAGGGTAGKADAATVAEVERVWALLAKGKR